MKLLVVTDLESRSSDFLNEALEWATRFADWVWIVHVEDPDPAFVGYEAGPQSVRDSVASEFEEDHRWLEEEADRWRERGLDTVALTLQGYIVDTILAQATKVEADAIVMGAPSHGQWHDFLLGNVTDSLLRKTPCPVLVIPRMNQES